MSSFTYSFTLTNLHQFKFRLQTSLLNPLITFDEKCDKILEGKVLRNVTHRLTKNNPFRSITSDNNNYHHTYLNMHGHWTIDNRQYRHIICMLTHKSSFMHKLCNNTLNIIHLKTPLKLLQNRCLAYRKT